MVKVFENITKYMESSTQYMKERTKQLTLQETTRQKELDLQMKYLDIPNRDLEFEELSGINSEKYSRDKKDFYIFCSNSNFAFLLKTGLEGTDVL